MSQFLLHTPGEPAGIGPELLVRLAQQPSPHCRVAVADRELLRRTARDLNLPLELAPKPAEPQATPAGWLWLEDIAGCASVPYGHPSPQNAGYLLACLDRACALAHAASSAMITGPLNKASISSSGIAFSGHTEYLAARCGLTAPPVMLLVAGDLRVALATTHLPLRAVPDALSTASIRHVLETLIHDLKLRFGLAQPRIQVCGLNPHAGEDGHLGDEDQRIIVPALKNIEDAEVIGPVPADTAFTPRRLAQCDAVLTMYHDQGLPVLKHVGFGHAVNVTLGLPIIRTSVDHGTAFDIAGRGIADLGSLAAAEALAIEMNNHEP